VTPGETAKDFATLERVLDELAGAGLDRRTTLYALGGGVVGDLGGLAASLFMRGIEVVQCPTTLLAMVDSAIGGKTAVNLQSGKNLAGTFHPPLAVHADVETLATLPAEELASGLGEVVKSALIGDPGLLGLLEAEAARIRAGDADLLTEIVVRCVRVKAAVVAEDERESDRRRVLNLGHTFAHAIEQVAGYGVVPHGIAVGVGLVLALEASREIELLEEPGLVGQVRGVLGSLGLRADLDALRERTGMALDAPALMRAMRLDKKARNGTPRFVLVRRAGHAEVDAPLEADRVEALLAPR
jgi:3-dehydroquinate synthase